MSHCDSLKEVFFWVWVSRMLEGAGSQADQDFRLEDAQRRDFQGSVFFPYGLPRTASFSL